MNIWIRYDWAKYFILHSAPFLYETVHVILTAMAYKVSNQVCLYIFIWVTQKYTQTHV